MHVEMPIVSFICTALVLSPLLWHWRARNIPVLSLIFWFTVVNLPRGINSIVWAESTTNYAPVWCDIITKLDMGAHYAYAASAACVCRNLARVSSPHYTIPNKAEKRTQLICEIFMCAVWPTIGMALHYIVQGHRFDIVEDFGCTPTVYVSIPAIFLVYIPPIICALVTLVYSAVALRWLIHRRAHFHTGLSTDSSTLTNRRYVRLVALSMTLMVSVTAMMIYTLVANVTRNRIQPWISWESVHSNWNRADEYPKSLTDESSLVRYLVVWYMAPFGSVIFFAFFGLGQEAKEEYTKYLRFVKTKVLRIKPKEQPVLPISVGNEATRPTTTTHPDDLNPLPGNLISSAPGDGKEVSLSSVDSISRPPSPVPIFHDKHKSIH